MAFSALMGIGIKAMAANYAQLQTTSHNIANVNVAGYSRQEVELATATGQYTSRGFFGHGVNVATVKRAHNDFLTKEASNTQALASMDAARLDQLKGMENVFKPGEEGLGNATTKLFDAFADLSSHPDDLSTRQVVLARASDLARRFNDAGTALDEAQVAVTADLKAAVTTINGLTKSIANVNGRIAALRGVGQSANDLLDERERLIGKLSEQVKITRIDADDGSVAVFAGGGQRLVLGSDAAELRVVQDEQDPTRAAVGIVDGSDVRVVDAEGYGGGVISGLLRFQNNDLSTARALVGRMAAAVSGAVNEQQARGLTLLPPLGTQFGPKMFDVGPPQALNNANNAKAGGVFIGGVTMTVKHPEMLEASDYDLRESTTVPGAWDLRRLSDNRVVTINSGDEVDGIQFTLNSPQAGDRFLLQPVSHAAQGMHALLENPRDVAAASPLLANTAATNTGSAVVSSLTVTKSPLPVPNGTTKITFTDNLGNYSWTQLDSGGVPVGAGAGLWQAGKPMPTPPLDINGFSIKLSGVPKTGDVINIVPTPAASVAKNNGNAMAAQGLRDDSIVAGRTASDAWSQALADVGVRVQSAKSVSSISTAAAQQAELARSSQAGVNLDEEAARLIQFQQSYQSAAKILQVAQQVFDTLLQTAAR